MEELQNGLSERAQWFRIGMISATVLTPLITRWRSLRAAERARDLWESGRTGARWPGTAGRAEVNLPPVARRQQVSTGVWLAGAGVGLLVAGTLAFVVARRRILSGDEAPLELTLEPGSNGANGANGAGRAIGDRAREIMGRATRMSAATAAARDGGQGAADAVTPRTPSAAEAQTAEPEEAHFIGNVKTLVYHDAGADDLPAEEDRVNFATREQAEAAGFRPVKGEVAR